MACFSPLHGFRSPGGQIKFCRSEAYSDKPLTVSCGQCLGCRLERSRQWAVRCMHEAQMSSTSSYLTLTYSDENMPEDKSLNVKHFQDFMRRLRHHYPQHLRYFHCGEYDATWRPHYHALLYNEDFRSDRKHFKNNKQGDPLYKSETLTDLWEHGFATIGNLTMESAAYVARYAMKKITGEKAAAHYERLNLKTGELYQLKREYITMSLKPAIGQKWIEKFYRDVYPNDEIMNKAGQKSRPPKAYDRYCDVRDPELMANIRSRRKHEGTKHDANNTYDRLAVRERTQSARIKYLTRS